MFSFTNFLLPSLLVPSDISACAPRNFIVFVVYLASFLLHMLCIRMSRYFSFVTKITICHFPHSMIDRVNLLFRWFSVNDVFCCYMPDQVFFFLSNSHCYSLKTSLLWLHSLLTVSFGLPTEVLTIFLSAVFGNFWSFPFFFVLNTLPVVADVFWVVWTISGNSLEIHLRLRSHNFHFCFSKIFSHDFSE